MPQDESSKPKPQRENTAQPWRTEGLPTKPDAPGDSRPPRPPWWRLLAWALVVYLASFLLFSMQDLTSTPTTVAYTEFQAQVQAHNVKDIYAKGNTIQGTLKDARQVPGEPEGRTYTQFATERPTFAQDDLMAALSQGDAVVRATPVIEQRGPIANFLLSFGPMLLLIGVYVWFYRRMMRSGGGGGLGALGMGKKKIEAVDPSQVRVTFDDVAGIDEVEREVAEVVDFLKNPEKYRRLGAKPPRGVLLTGEPGTGKTLLARATAGEAGVPFFSASASEFIEMIVGVGAQRVRDLFAEARKAAPAIIFIDEIDTIGRSRGGARSMGGNDEREQTLNQVLTEMDGFDGSEGVVVMAATNRSDVLDAALTRPGRFDRIITVHAPDAGGRAQILRVHTRDVPLAPDVDLTAVAHATPGMTGASLANLVNEAAILAAQQGEAHVTQADLMRALEKVQLGVARDVVIDPAELRRTAYHEAGHALLGMLQPGADPVRKVSIIPRGQALGVTLSTPDADRYGYDEPYLRGRIIGALGGWAAEQTEYGVTTTGVDSDLQQVTNLARNMVGRWGMSDKVGAITALSNDGDPRILGISEATLAAVDDEARRIIRECQADALRILSENRQRLDGIVTALLEHETLDEPQAYAAAGLPRPASEERTPLEK
ncbi:ATP-dependent zinc metalloprotease FtsH [Nigerium sp.]|jgi:cell division protease FtsH|uniref:ATP-dependent zinc metalloprotease FtsH n=1 Tax=Nigerium sp. TaxID=2042655 RepID=UPI003221ED3C